MGAPAARRWGTVVVPLNEWTFVAAAYGPDGKRTHFINGDHSEAAACSATAGVPLQVTKHDFKFGARGRCCCAGGRWGSFPRARWAPKSVRDRA